MTDHLPECVSRNEDYGIEFVCICRELRACEQRVMSMRHHERAGWQEMKEARAYGLGIQAAREAVERVSSLLQPLGPALAAIDALKEDK